MKCKLRKPEMRPPPRIGVPCAEHSFGLESGSPHGDEIEQRPQFAGKRLSEISTARPRSGPLGALRQGLVRAAASSSWGALDPAHSVGRFPRVPKRRVGLQIVIKNSARKRRLPMPGTVTPARYFRRTMAADAMNDDSRSTASATLRFGGRAFGLRHPGVFKRQRRDGSPPRCPANR